MKILNNKYARIIGVATTAALLLTEPALANDLDLSKFSADGLLDVISGRAASVYDAIMVFSLMMGGFFFIAGLFKLKQAADSNGQQAKYGDGVTRILIGAALMSPGLILGIATGTIFGDAAKQEDQLQDKFQNRFNNLNLNSERKNDSSAFGSK